MLDNNKTFCSHAPLFLGANYFILNNFYLIFNKCIYYNQSEHSFYLIIFFELSTSIWAELMAHPLGPYWLKNRADLNAWTETSSWSIHKALKLKPSLARRRFFPPMTTNVTPSQRVGEARLSKRLLMRHPTTLNLRDPCGMRINGQEALALHLLQTIKTHFFLTYSLHNLSFLLNARALKNLSYTKTSFTLLLLHLHTMYFPPPIYISKYLFILPITLPELWFIVNLSSLFGLNCVCILFGVYTFVLAFSAMDYTLMYSCAKKELLKGVSYYTTHLRLRDLRENGCSMSKRHEGNVKTVECREGEPICCDESSDPGGPFCFFYVTFFKKVLLRLPLSIFEKEQPSSMFPLPSYTLIAGHFFVFLSFCAHSSKSPRLLKFFSNSSRLNTRAISCGYLWTVPLEELCSPSSNLHINFKGNFVKV